MQKFTAKIVNMMNSEKLFENQGGPIIVSQGINEGSGEKLAKSHKLLVKKLSDSFLDKPNWNPRDTEQLKAVKEALHVSNVPSMVVCREDEQKRVLEFCKECIEQEKAGSLYVCGCPGTRKSLSIETFERVKESLLDWAKEIHGWRAWEDEAHMDRHDSLTEITRELTMRRQSFFVKFHASNPLARNNFLIWVTCFFRQFGNSVVRADYLTLPKAFILFLLLFPCLWSDRFTT